MAHYWGKKPSELGLCKPDDDPAVMMAYFQTARTMEAYDALQQQKAVEKNKPKQRGKG